MSARYVVQAWNGARWTKVRGPEGGPWLRASRAERIARGRSTDGVPHRVVKS